MDEALKNQYGRPRLDDRQIDELIGIARGILADGYLDDREVKFLHAWLAANRHITGNALVEKLYDRIEEVLSDGVIDQDERADLISTLTAFCQNDFAVGEALKAGTLPLNSPSPIVSFTDKRFCFTGTFVFGSRAECKKAVSERGGLVGTLTQKTDFLVIGEYATDSWKHSTFGNKIEKAIVFRDTKKLPIAIISEPYWRSAL
ncbi:MAG: hypothetical protein DHS20C05_22430 [Hyphococcus sp.]|nr:MAG: hypothetical protein DHS20C05_22430 [Marinicaulis sp.]